MPSLNPYEQMRSARTAVQEDDVVSGICDITEALAFKGGCHWESSSPDEADVFNQLSAELDLDAVLRRIWRDDYTYGQAVVAKIWDWRDTYVRGTTANGNRRKKKYRVYTPVQLRLLDPLHVVPIGWGPLREDRLAWQATDYEIGQHLRVSSGSISDPMMMAFFTGRYDSQHPFERMRFGAWGVQFNQLLEMSKGWVFRHAPTRPDYEPFAALPIRSIFTDLDMKRQLIMSDRAHLVGAANYLLLIRKGSDHSPAKAEEMAQLQESYQFLAKVPVIISDHRLQIDIIAPKQDFVLRADAYSTVDTHILNRMLRSFAAPGRTAATNADGSFYDVLALAVDNRRHMIKRTLEKELSRAIVNHPRNAGVFETVPSLAFTPGGVKVGNNQAVLSALLSLRTQREISRETILAVLGLDESVEAERVRFEAETYDATFRTHIPFDGQTPAMNGPGGGGTGGANGITIPGTMDDNDAISGTGPNVGENSGGGPGGADAGETPDGGASQPGEAPTSSGRRGGRPYGGGNSPNSPAAVARPKTGNGNPSTKGL
jgi:hypothetical protein